MKLKEAIYGGFIGGWMYSLILNGLIFIPIVVYQAFGTNWKFFVIVIFYWSGTIVAMINNQEFRFSLRGVRETLKGERNDKR